MRLAVLAVCSAAALTGCSSPGPAVACTKTGMRSGVTVGWRPADFGGRDAARIRLCVEGTCEERASGDPGDPFRSVTVRLPDDVGAVTVPVRLTVTSARTGDPVVADGARAKLAERHPNGRSCPPTAWTAVYRAEPGKGLTSPKGLSLQGG